MNVSKELTSGEECARLGHRHRPVKTQRVEAFNRQLCTTLQKYKDAIWKCISSLFDLFFSNVETAMGGGVIH